MNQIEEWSSSHVSAQPNMDDLIWAGISSGPGKFQIRRRLPWIEKYNRGNSNTQIICGKITTA